MLAVTAMSAISGTPSGTGPNQLGVDYNGHILATIARDIAPAIGWTPADAATAA